MLGDVQTIHNARDKICLRPTIDPTPSPTDAPPARPTRSLTSKPTQPPITDYTLEEYITFKSRSLLSENNIPVNAWIHQMIHTLQRKCRKEGGVKVIISFANNINGA